MLKGGINLITPRNQLIFVKLFYFPFISTGIFFCPGSTTQLSTLEKPINKEIQFIGRSLIWHFYTKYILLNELPENIQNTSYVPMFWMVNFFFQLLIEHRNCQMLEYTEHITFEALRHVNLNYHRNIEFYLVSKVLISFN